MTAETPGKIVVFLPNWVGDVVMATPVLRALREHFADSRIVYFGKPIALDVLAGNEWADDSVVATPQARGKLRGVLELSASLRKDEFDLAVLLPNSFRSAILAKLARVKQIVGYARDWRSLLLDEKLHAPKDSDGRFLPIPTIDYYCNLVSHLGVPISSKQMALPVTKREEYLAQRLMEDAGIESDQPIVVLNPGASFGVSKMWDPEKYAATADALIERRDAQIIINVAPNERRIGQMVAANMKHKPALNFAERDNTLLLLRSILKRSHLLITNDTGPRHIAAAMGAGVVTLFGSTDPRWAQIDYPLEKIIRIDLRCSPCQRKICNQPPGPAYHKCMRLITPDMVVSASEELLDSMAPLAQRGGLDV